MQSAMRPRNYHDGVIRARTEKFDQPFHFPTMKSDSRFVLNSLANSNKILSPKKQKSIQISQSSFKWQY